MVNRFRSLLLSSSFLSMGVLIGCGGPSTIKTEYVEGLLTVDGEPVPDATVQFVPVNEGQGLPAVGMTDERGIYTLTASPGGDQRAEHGGGTTPGEYHVGIIANKVDTPMSPEEAEEAGIEYQPPSEAEQRQGPPITYVVPQKYNYPKGSGITVTVSEGKNDIPLELTR